MVQALDFFDTLFADDLNCYADCEAAVDNDDAIEDLKKCQAAVHEWGRANQVEFDSGKESFHVLHRRDPEGESFRVLEVLWDFKLSMKPEYKKRSRKAFVKLRALLKVK